MTDLVLHPLDRPRPRPRLAAVLRATDRLVRVDDVMATLALNRPAAAKTLARWHAQGWLQRVGPGVYTPIPLDALATEQVLDDPWILVPALFDPAYIGGWTAAEYWDLTEQLFRDILVFTAKPLRTRQHVVHGISFALRHIQPIAIFGTRAIWRGRLKVQISDIHRTMIDMLADPSVGGGIRHVADCLAAYLKHKDADPSMLIRYAETLKNGAVFKRLGFLASTFPDQAALVEACRSRLTQGNAKLDPKLPCVKLVKAWRLWIPATWTRAPAGTGRPARD
jgi:predicted transcriptional regulator of viral defense system